MSRTLVVLLSLCIAASAEAREGFGFTKKSVVMDVRNPPALNLGARRVKVVVESERSADKDDARALMRLTEELILNGGGTIAGEKDRGDVVIKLALDRIESHESWETKTESSYEKIGEKQVYNEKKKKNETKDVYGNVPRTVQIKVVTGSLSGAYDIADRSGKVVDSGSLSQEFRQKYDKGTNAATPTEIEDDLMSDAALAVAARLVPTRGRVAVLVPKGSFESYIPFAESNTWDRYLASVEAVKPKKDARQEAYRQYALAVGKEGLAYSLDDRARTIELLREAVGHYDNAITGNPAEKIFREAYSSLFSRGAGAPLPRAQASLTAFEEWSAGAPSSRTAAVRTASTTSVPALSNQTLIEMSKAGLAEENLILAINEASEVDFDTSPNALISLAKAGVSKNVIASMQKKVSRR